MKKTLLIFLITGLTQLQAQMPFEFIALTINFENGADSIIQYSTDSSFSTHWQMGTPSKTIFDSAYSTNKAMVTDTLNPYQPNSHTWFEIPFVPNIYLPFNEPICPLNICFQHKLDIDEGYDVGWIDIRDNDQLFNIGEFNGWNILSGSNYLYFESQMENAYWAGDTLPNGQSGYITNVTDWTRSCYSLYWIGLGVERAFDTLYFRFNFVSDSASTGLHDGWIVDDIEIGKGFGFCGGGIDELDKLVSIYPNPADDYFVLHSMYEFTHGKMEIVNMLGEIQLSKELEYDESIFVSLAQLNTGAYFVRFNLDGKYATKKIFIR
jgi:hypothetical protein